MFYYRARARGGGGRQLTARVGPYDDNDANNNNNHVTPQCSLRARARRRRRPACARQLFSHTTGPGRIAAMRAPGPGRMPRSTHARAAVAYPLFASCSGDLRARCIVAYITYATRATFLITRHPSTGVEGALLISPRPAYSCIDQLFIQTRVSGA